MNRYPHLHYILSAAEPTQSDLEDAFSVLLVVAEQDDYGEPLPGVEDQYRKKWNAALSKAKMITFPMEEAARKFSVNDYGRRVDESYLSNPIIVAQVGKDFSVLDGSHRLITAYEKGLKEIQAYVVPLPWASDLITAMDGFTIL